VACAPVVATTLSRTLHLLTILTAAVPLLLAVPKFPTKIFPSK